jgi:hypothetical protein
MLIVDIQIEEPENRFSTDEDIIEALKTYLEG